MATTQAEKLPRWEFTLRGRMLTTLASLALCGAWITGDAHACLAAALLISPIVVDRLWKGRGLPPLQATLSARRTEVGSLFLETFRLRNAGPTRAIQELRVYEPKIGTRAGGAYIDALGPGRSVQLRLPCRCLRRGRLTERTLRCETSYPLGILRNHAEITCQVELIAEPARIALPPHLQQSEEDSFSDPSARSLQGSQEFYALREYRLGEDARGVHALRSASAGTLICRVTRGQQEQRPCLVLDLRRPPGYSTRRTGPRFEWSLSAAATLIDQLSRSGSQLTFFVLGAPAQLFEVSTLTEAEDLLAFLAEARPRPHNTIDAELMERIASHQSCYWIPAGGFAARRERADMRRTVLVTREPQDG